MKLLAGSGSVGLVCEGAEEALLEIFEGHLLASKR